MSNNSNSNYNTGVGFLGLLAIVFIVLKLTGHINWSWWWVLAPIWISWSVLLVVLFIILIVWLVFIKDK